MSYILDALRRAQAERERGQVPGLHAQTGVHRELPQRRAALPGLVWLMLCAALALAVAALLSLWWLRQAATPPAAAAPPITRAARPAVIAMAPAVSGQPTAQASLQAPLQALAQAPAQAIAQASAQAPNQPPTAARVASWPVVVSVPALPPRAPLPAASIGPSAPAPATTTAPAVATATVALSALTPEQRRDWPALALGGSVWSDNVASRFVIFNGTVWREGDEVSPGVVLARIGPKAAQLRWRNTLVEVPL